MDINKKAIIFHAGKEEYAIPVGHVISIEKPENITPIPQLPQYVLGITKVRGELVPVIDFANILYGRTESTSDKKLIVLKSEILSLGIIVNEAKEILDIPEGALTQMGLMAYSRTKYFSGVINLEDRLITMVDPDILVESLDGIREIQDYMRAQQV
ncbi:chemotaxis protein CheW [Rossellomorea vietnamensis]|uniref:Chemotaxis protein CheW n=1 Tax=Rossellomorea vietnamensis TaxID=218284 RepID=A0A5D4MI50_9BACI|nr:MULTISPECIES: chemotaxis protein CheW [Bacillaceae]TYS00656.1 chemotaxis protein CheW [Rossellomorea vietnamensis]